MIKKLLSKIIYTEKQIKIIYVENKKFVKKIINYLILSNELNEIKLNSVGQWNELD